MMRMPIRRRLPGLLALTCTLFSLLLSLGIWHASQAAAPQGEPAWRLYAIPVEATALDSTARLSDLAHQYTLLDFIELDGEPYLLTLNAQPGEGRLLAQGSLDARLVWLYLSDVLPRPANLSPILTQPRRLLLAASAAEWEKWEQAGYQVIELQRLAAPRPSRPRARTEISYDPALADLLSQVNASTLSGYVADLSGERSVAIGGHQATIQTRYSYSEGIKDATQYLHNYFSGLGLETDLWSYGTRGWVNVVATQRGTLHPEQVYIISSHYDSISTNPYVRAPGADDNASGTAAVMAAAQVLHTHSFAYTIRYVCFSGEEQGLYGSKAYAHQANLLNEEILGVVNLDMIAWDAEDGPAFELHARTAPSQELADVFSDVAQTYDLDLDVELLAGGAALDVSDHAAFWNEGFAAFLGIEDDSSDFNTHYHTIHDRLQYLNLVYFTEATKASLGAVANLAELRPAPEPSPTPTNTPSPTATPAMPNALRNGNFEGGPTATGWQANSAHGSTLISSELPYTGQWGAWISQNTNATDSLCQSVTLPAGAQASQLSFWWRMHTDEPSHTYIRDWLRVQVQPAGASSPTVLTRMDDSALQHLWQHVELSLDEYAGKTLQVCFVGGSDSNRLSSFFLDDIWLTYRESTLTRRGVLPLLRR